MLISTSRKYKFSDQSNCIRIGNLLDDMWQVHDYFHRWQDQRYKDLNELRSLNKSLSRKIKGSNGWRRCVRQLARLYRKITNQRKDFQWRPLASDLCKKYDTIAIETLNLDGMKRLWGRKVSDLAFYQFVEILKYKCQKHKRQLVQIGQWTATTKPCSDCGFHNETLTLSDRQWTCPECASHHD
ncbi:transposase [Candidatus Poribacteria bacterium]|nr:transposase [Candidatus Poribacteria bacterium]MYA54805.1 transposase [Candidatus Poribacteria bacterium]